MPLPIVWMLGAILFSILVITSSLSAKMSCLKEKQWCPIGDCDCCQGPSGLEGDRGFNGIQGLTGLQGASSTLPPSMWGHGSTIGLIFEEHNYWYSLAILEFSTAYPDNFGPSGAILKSGWYCVEINAAYNPLRQIYYPVLMTTELGPTSVGATEVIVYLRVTDEVPWILAVYYGKPDEAVPETFTVLVTYLSP